MFIQCSDFLSECLDFLKSLLSAQVLSTEQTFFSLSFPPLLFFFLLCSHGSFSFLLFPVVVPVSPHRSGHSWMQTNTLKLQNSGDRCTLDFLFCYYYFISLLSFCIKKTWRNMLFFQLPMGEYVLAWDGIMALGLRTKSGMGIQTARVLVSYSVLGPSVAGDEQLWDRDKGWAHPFNVAAEQTAKSRWVKLKSGLFPKKTTEAHILIPKNTRCSPA